MKPIIAIVGRPNVGKSMLFNKLVGQRLSIVEDTPGVTRDRLYAEAEWRNRKFDLVDTGGIEPSADSQILAFMRQQAEIAIQHATVILFVCDIKTGLTASDQEVANMLLRSQKPVVLAVNKMDQVGITNPDIYEFYNLGLGDPIAVSAVHGHGTGDLLDACMEDSKSKGKKGLCILSSGKKKPFLSDPKFLRYKGFKVCDEADNGIQLWYLPFAADAPLPEFKECARHPHIEEKGYVLYYTSQCPFNAKYVPIVEEVARENGVSFQAIHLQSKEEAQNAPTPVTTYALFYNGAYLTNEQMNDRKFLKLLSK